MSEKTVLDREDVRRTLVRIAHEIVEKTGGQGVAVVGIHRRGAVLAARLRDLVAELVGEPVPLGDIDISFYRDDLARREPTAQPVVHASHVDFPVEDTTIVLVDDVLYTGRTVRAGIDALFDYGRPERVQLAVLADRGHRELPIRPDYVGKNLPTARGERVNVRVEEIDGVDEVVIARTAWRTLRMRRHLLSVDDLSRDDIERILGRAESFAEVSGREIKKVPDAARAHGHQPLLRGLDAHQLELRAGRQAALSADLVSVKSSGSAVDKGESLKDTVQTLSAYDPARDRDPLAARRRRRAGGALDARLGDQRRRRQARAPDPGAARPLHAASAGSARSRGCASGSSATCCTAASRARASWPSRAWAARSRSAARRR